jgi:hypothetical protein
MDDAIVDGDVAGVDGGVGQVHAPAFADLDAAGAEVVEAGAAHAAVLAAAAEPEAVDADVLDRTRLEVDLAGAIDHQRGGDSDLGLAVGVSALGQDVVAMRKGEAAEGEVLDQGAQGRVALEDEEGVRAGRRDDLRLGHVLARQRDVGEGAVAVEEPLAGGVEGFAEVLQVIALVGTPLAETPGDGTGDEEPGGGRFHQIEP